LCVLAPVVDGDLLAGLGGLEQRGERLDGGGLGAVDGVEGIAGLQLARRGAGVVDLLRGDGLGELQIVQGGVLGVVLGAPEVGVLGLLDVVAGLLRREHQVAGNQLVLPGAPERQRLAQGQAVALGDRRHVQVPGGLLDGGALDGDHRLAVVVAEGVERRARTQRHVGHRHGGQQHAEDDDGHQRDHHRQNPPVHAPQGSGYG
jgi:hypothetical protein